MVNFYVATWSKSAQNEYNMCSFCAIFVDCVTVKINAHCVSMINTMCMHDSHYFLQVGLYDLDHSIAIQVNYANLKETIIWLAHTHMEYSNLYKFKTLTVFITSGRHLIQFIIIIFTP